MNYRILTLNMMKTLQQSINNEQQNLNTYKQNMNTEQHCYSFTESFYFELFEVSSSVSAIFKQLKITN